MDETANKTTNEIIEPRTGVEDMPLEAGPGDTDAGVSTNDPDCPSAAEASPAASGTNLPTESSMQTQGQFNDPANGCSIAPQQ